MSRHASSILNIEYERVCYFVIGLRLPICMSCQSIVYAGRSFVEVYDYAWVIEDIHHEA